MYLKYKSKQIETIKPSLSVLAYLKELASPSLRLERHLIDLLFAGANDG